MISEPTDLVAVRTALQDAGIDYDSAEASSSRRSVSPLTLKPPAGVQTSSTHWKTATTSRTYTNIDIPDDVAAQLDED